MYDQSCSRILSSPLSIQRHPNGSILHIETVRSCSASACNYHEAPLRISQYHHIVQCFCTPATVLHGAFLDATWRPLPGAHLASLSFPLSSCWPCTQCCLPDGRLASPAFPLSSLPNGTRHPLLGAPLAFPAFPLLSLPDGAWHPLPGTPLTSLVFPFALVLAMCAALHA